MNGRTLVTTGLLTLAFGLFLLAAGGCGSDRRSAPGSPVIAADQDIWVRELPSGGAGPLGQGTSPKGGIAWAPASPSITAKVDGDMGGVIVIGRISVIFPPGAFTGSRVITVDVQNTGGYLECHLFPEGLKFDQPVLLGMSVLNTTGDLPGTTIYWYDPTTDTWVDMQAAYHATLHGVVARLQHFSTYRTGRSGW